MLFTAIQSCLWLGCFYPHRDQISVLQNKTSEVVANQPQTPRKQNYRVVVWVETSWNAVYDKILYYLSILVYLKSVIIKLLLSFHCIESNTSFSKLLTVKTVYDVKMSFFPRMYTERKNRWRTLQLFTVSWMLLRSDWGLFKATWKIHQGLLTGAWMTFNNILTTMVGNYFLGT